MILNKNIHDGLLSKTEKNQEGKQKSFEPQENNLLHPWRLTWNMSSWRFGSDHFPFYIHGWFVGSMSIFQGVQCTCLQYSHGFKDDSDVMPQNLTKISTLSTRKHRKASCYFEDPNSASYRFNPSHWSVQWFLGLLKCSLLNHFTKG